jgi:hypothetical protein
MSNPIGSIQFNPPPPVTMGDTSKSVGEVDTTGSLGSQAAQQFSGYNTLNAQIDADGRTQELALGRMTAEATTNMAMNNNALGIQLSLHEAALKSKTLDIQGDHVEKSDLHFETARDADNTLTAMMNDIRNDPKLSAAEKTKAIGELYATQRQGDAANMHYSNQTTLASTSNNVANTQSSGMIGQNSQGANAMLMGQGNQFTGIGVGSAGFTQGFNISGDGGAVGMMPPMPTNSLFSSSVDTTFGLLGGTGNPVTLSGLSAVPSGNVTAVAAATPRV